MTISTKNTYNKVTFEFYHESRLEIGLELFKPKKYFHPPENSIYSPDKY